jgi:hypothetical protein
MSMTGYLWYPSITTTVVVDGSIIKKLCAILDMALDVFNVDDATLREMDIDAEIESLHRPEKSPQTGHRRISHRHHARPSLSKYMKRYRLPTHCQK